MDIAKYRQVIHTASLLSFRHLDLTMPRAASSTTKNVNLKQVAARAKLVARESKEPYWETLGRGQYLGFRPSTVSSAGTWLARFVDTATGKRPSLSLGTFDQLAPNERYDMAVKEARAWFTKLAAGGSSEVITVGEACRRYAEGKPDAEGRFQRHVLNDPIAKIVLDKLQRRHVADWRKRLQSKPAVVGARKDRATSQTRERSPASLNRDMVPLRAALNVARDEGHVLTDLAWRVALKPAEANGRRDVYLDIDQRRALVAHMSDDIRPFFDALARLPLRPGALAALRVKDFNERTGSLIVATDKAGGGRSIPLSSDMEKLFAAQCRFRHGQPDAPIFRRTDGAPWSKQTWKRPIKDAAAAAGLPAAVVSYSLRHSTITDLVTNGLDLLTVALLSGTSVAMIQKHYGHIRGDHAREAMARLAL